MQNKKPLAPTIAQTFAEADCAYRTVIESHGHNLPAALAAARSVSRIDLNADDITHAVLLRCKSFFLCQKKIKSELGKVYATPAADFFVETVCFFLKVVFEKLAPVLNVASEKDIAPVKGAMRPDISIWRDKEVVAAIECKTQLGWKRDSWLDDFEKREKRLADKFPKAKPRAGSGLQPEPF